MRSSVAGRVGLDLPPLPRGEPGDPGLFGPGSIVWTIGRERILLVGGQAALLLQLAHPLVAGGVAGQSRFARDPFARLRATLHAVLTISFGDQRQSEAAAAAVRATHNRVRGRLAERVGRFGAGTRYDASDPQLALWVHATLVTTALDTYDLFVRRLTREDRARYWAETAPFAELFGVGPRVLPSGYAAFEGYFASMVTGPDLAVGSPARAVAAGVLRPPLPTLLGPARSVARVITAALLPPPIRSAYGLPWGRAERSAVGALAASARAASPLLPERVRFWPHYRLARARAATGHSNTDRAAG
jgi:uncharacterized protein (DUF2236 family)